MASEAITRNDLTAILNEVLPPTPSEYRKLLWTNPSPTSSFAAQTVSLDLSDYDEVEVICKPYSSDTSYFASRVKVGNKGMIYSQTGYGSPVRIYGTQRNFTPTSTGVAFGDGLDFSASVSNAYCVPYQIYGISYDRVVPPQTFDPQEITVSINGSGAMGDMKAYKMGQLVVVTGLIRPKLTGTNLTLATVTGCPATARVWGQCGGYANASEELFMSENSADIVFNVTAINDLKINFSYITTA